MFELLTYESQFVSFVVSNFDSETSYSADKDNIKEYTYKETLMEYEYIKSDDDVHNIIQEIAKYDFENFDFRAFYSDKHQRNHSQLKMEDISLDVEDKKIDTNDV